MKKIHLRKRLPRDDDPPGVIKPACGIYYFGMNRNCTNDRKEVTCERCMKTHKYRKNKTNDIRK